METLNSSGNIKFKMLSWLDFIIVRYSHAVSDLKKYIYFVMLLLQSTAPEAAVSVLLDHFTQTCQNIKISTNELVL